MGKIKILSQEMVDLIAAGEVVERPASVLKELLENSIDAKATRIKVGIEAGGVEKIQVKDNGTGIESEDISLVFKQHATSKIFGPSDLSKIYSFGFRGEALASIAAVAEKIELQTKTATEENGTIFTISGNQNKSENRPNLDTGTTITVFNLFEKIPARKKFLKTLKTETKYLFDIFIQVALKHTQIEFELVNDNKTVYKLPPTDDLKTRVFDLWDRKTAEGMLDKIEYWDEICNITLWLGKPEISRVSQYFQFIFVNGRPIYNKTILSALNEAFRGFIHKDLKPVFIVDIHINPDKVDVNIHPRKSEVKFEDNEFIFKKIYSLVRKKLDLLNKEIAYDYKGLEAHVRPAMQGSGTLGSSKENTQGLSFKMPYANQRTLFSEQMATFNVPAYNPSTFTPFQIFNTYIVYEEGETINFVDQHAAAEKIAFEKILYKNLNYLNKPLLVPQVTDLKKDLLDLILENKEELSSLGIVIEQFGENSIQLLEIPEEIKNLDLATYAQRLSEPDLHLLKYYEVILEDYQIKISPELYLLYATTACHGSVRAGQKLTEPEMVQILKSLSELKSPGSCPHGRPIRWQLSKYELEKNFKRII